VREKAKSDAMQANHSKSASMHVPLDVLVNLLWLIVAWLQQRERTRRRECHGGVLMLLSDLWTGKEQSGERTKIWLLNECS